MIRNLKVLGLAFAAVLAMSAVMASAAMAVPQFTASAYPVTVTGSAAQGSEYLGTEAGQVECDSHFASHSLAGPSSTLTITPTYTGCTAFGFNATVNTEGCSYVFHATEKVFVGTYRHHIDVVCPAGKSIKIVAGGGICRAEIKGQTGLTTVETTNLSTSLTLNWKISGIAYTVTTDSFGCPFTGTGNKTGGVYFGHTYLSRVGGGGASVSGE